MSISLAASILRHLLVHKIIRLWWGEKKLSIESPLWFTPVNSTLQPKFDKVYCHFIFHLES